MVVRAHTPPLTPIERKGIHSLRGFILFLSLIATSCILPLVISLAMGHSPLPVWAWEAVTIATLCLAGFYLILQKNKTKRLLPLLIIIGVLTTLYTGSILPFTTLLSILFTISEGALLLAVADRKQLMLVPFLPILSFSLATLMCGRLFYGILALLPFPPMMALSLSTRKAAEKNNGLTRVGIICLTSVALGLSAVAIAAYAFYLTTDTPDLSTLYALVDGARMSLIDTLNQAAASLGTPVPSALSPEVITDMVNDLFWLLPAYAVLCCNILATLAQMIFLSELSEFCSPMNERLKAFRISLISSAVFILGYAVLLFSSADEITVSIAAVENLVLILTPALAWAGILHILFNLARRGSRGGCAPLLYMLVPCLLFIAPWVPAFYEAGYNIITPIRRRKKPPTDPS